MDYNIPVFVSSSPFFGYILCPALHLICAVPFEGFEKRWSLEEQEKYSAILKQADLVKYICEHYSRSCFQLRNIYMYDRCSRVIAMYNSSSGGTRNMIEYARRKGVGLVNIFDNVA